MRSGTRALALLVVALVTACGSTVAPVGQGFTPAGALPVGAGGATDGLGAAGGATASGVGGPLGGSLPAAATNAAVQAGREGPTSGGNRARTPATAPGAAARRPPAVKIGFFVAKDVGAATAALGYDGLSTGDGRRHAETTVQLLNRRGGIGGAKVAPVIFEYDVTQNGDTQQQAACSAFFEDDRVAAVVSILLLPIVMTCAEKYGAPFVTNGDRSTGEQQLARYPHAALPATMSLGRVAATLIPSLQRQGWFTAGSATDPVKVGLLYNEDSEFAQVPAQVAAQLQRIGLGLTDQQAMPTTDDTSKTSRAANAGSSAVLRFRSKGITHVLAISKSGQAVAYFAIAAQNQNYYPRFGLTSLELPAALRTVLSARQLEGARGVGWLPVYDVPLTAQPPATPDRRDCLAAMTAAGEDANASTSRGYALATCGGGLTLAAAWRKTPLTPAGFLSGLRALGRSFTSVSTFADDFSSNRDGVSRARPMAFTASCDCFVYTGPAAAVATKGS